MRNARMDESQAGIKSARRNNNLRYADDTILMAESQGEPLDEGAREELKIWCKTQYSKNGIWSHRFMANRWGKNGNSDRFFSWAAKSHGQ